MATAGESPDAADARRYLAGDEEGLRSLVERHQHVVFGLSLRMLGQRQDAEDVTQETFVRVVKSLHRWDRNRPFRPWLLAIAANRCRTVRERRATRPQPVAFVSDISEADQTTGTDEIAEELQRAIDQLKDNYRVCFILYYQNELSITEVAEAMETREGTIKTWLHRARSELAAYLQRRGLSPRPA